MLQRFTAESSRELSALRKLNNKQRQVSIFLILLFKLLNQLPFVSFLFSNPLTSPSPPSLLSLLRLKISLHSVSPMAHFFCILFHIMTFFPSRASEQVNVIGSVCIYIYVCTIVIERTRDLIYLKFVAKDFFPKIISSSAGENAGDSV